jgi:hypothetical protein
LRHELVPPRTDFSAKDIITHFGLFPRSVPAPADCHLDASSFGPPLLQQADVSDIIFSLPICLLG